MTARALTLSLLLLSTLSACSEPQPYVEPPVEDPLRPRPIFDLTATNEPSGFFDFPFPSDLRMTGEGAPDLANFWDPVYSSLLLDFRNGIARDIRGFSQSAGVYFRFTRPLDPASLPRDPAATLEEGATAFIVDVDAASPRRGYRWPAEVTFYADGGRYWQNDTLVVRPPAAMPLWPGTRYAVVVTRDVVGADGREAAGEPLFDELFLASEPPSGREAEWESLQPLVELAADEGFTDSVWVATVFTTADHIGDMRRMRAWIHEHVPEPTASPSRWALMTPPEGPDGYALYAGRFEIMDFLSGLPPYLVPGEGVILFDEERNPVEGRMTSVRFALTVPAGTPPEGGFPLALYSHGAGGSYRSFVRSVGVWGAQEGVAVLSMDNPMNGERDPASGDFVDYLIQLATTNAAAGRDMYRHGIPDMVQLARLARSGLTVPADVSHSGEEVGFDTTNLAFTSHSMGSQIGAMLVGVEPDIHSAFLSEGGGGAAAALLYRKADGTDIEYLVSLVLGVDLEREPLTADHPVVGLLVQTLLDPGDPLAFAYGAIRDPAGDPVPILMTEGLEDDQTIPVSVEALAAAYGIPIVAPVAHESEAHALWGIGAQPPPLADNVTVGPSLVSGGVLQFAGYGHYVFTENERAQDWFRGWIAGAAIGEPVIIDLD